MSYAVFASNITYAPGGGGAITQSFNVTAPYNAINAGTIDVATATAADTVLDVPFGAVAAARGVVIRNSTAVDLKVYINVVTPPVSEPFFRLPPGGMVMHWAPVAPGGSPISALKLTVTALTTAPGTIDYIVLGD